MPAPTSAMALVRTASRVWSASSAVTTAEMAPPLQHAAQDQFHQRASGGARKLPAAK